MGKLHDILRSPTAKNGAIFTFFSFCNNGVSFILLLILAHYISPDEYGVLNLFNTFIQLFSIFICLGSTGYIGVSFFKKKREDLVRTINAVFIIAGAILLLYLLILSIFSGFFEKVTGLDVRYQWVAIFICFFQVFNTVNLDIWRLEEKPFFYGLYSLSRVIFNFLITLVLVISFQKGWLGRLYAETIVATVYFIVSVVFLFKRKYISFELPKNKSFTELFRFGLPLIPHQASGWLKQGADRLIINSYLTVAVVGLFSFAMNFANIIYIFSTAFNSTNSVFIYKNLRDGYVRNKKKLHGQEKMMMLFFSALSILIATGCYIFIPIVVPKYSESIQFIFPLCLSAMFGCYYVLFVNYLFYYEKTKQIMCITFSASLIQVCLSFAFTRYGAIYTAYFYAFTQLITFLAVYFYSTRLLKEVERKELEDK